jgi:hypothetical protein
MAGPLGLVAAGIGVVTVLVAGQANAATPPVDLGTTAAFAVLGGSTVTNTGPSVIHGDVGVSPGTAITGFPPAVVDGTVHATDAVAARAQADSTTAYNRAAGEGPVTVKANNLGGDTLVPGVYAGTPVGGPLQLTGTLTLNGEGNPDAVFIFRTNSSLTTATGSVVALVNGATACNVFWQVGSSATLETGSTFVGTVDALASVTADKGATIDGRLLARTGAVTLDDNTITVPDCSAGSSPVTTPPVTTPSGTTPPATTPPVTTPPVTTSPSTTPPVTTTTHCGGGKHHPGGNHRPKAH